MLTPKQLLYSVLITMAFCEIVIGCGGGPTNPGGNVQKDAKSVQRIVDLHCGKEGIQSVASVGHGGGHGNTNGFLLVCKNNLIKVIAVGR